MLKPITNWNELRFALEARGEEIFVCMDCGRVFTASASKSPERCRAKGCGAYADYRKRDKTLSSK